MTRGRQINAYTPTRFTRLDEVGLYQALYPVFDYRNMTFGAQPSLSCCRPCLALAAVQVCTQRGMQEGAGCAG